MKKYFGKIQHIENQDVFFKEFTTKGSSCNDTGKITGSLEAKYKQANHGLTFQEKWTTDNNLSTEVSIEDQIATGLKFTLCTAFSPNTG